MRARRKGVLRFARPGRDTDVVGVSGLPRRGRQPVACWSWMRRAVRVSVEDKAMFSVGQRVWHRDGQRSGTVLECDQDRVFIAQDNGVEVDFRASDLTASPPPGAKGAGAKPNTRRELTRSASYVVPSRRLKPEDITPEHARVLAKVPLRTLQAVAVVFERRPGAGKFGALDVAGKLNAIADITAVPYRTMKEYSDRPGELGLLMGKGLADSRASG